MITIHIFGYFTIILALILCFFDIKYTFYSMIVLSLFTGTSALFIKLGSIDFTLFPGYLLGMTFIFRYFFIVIKKRSIIKPNYYLLIFIGICILSVILLPIIDNFIPSTVTVKQQLSGESFLPIKFSNTNITQLIYLIFCFFIYWASKDLISNEKQEVNVVKFFILACILIAILGIYELASMKFNLPFDEIFRNAHGAIKDFNFRISSATHEPSMFAYTVILGIAIYYFYSNNDYLSKYKYIGLPLLIIIGFLSTSTSFLLGIFVFSLYVIYDYLRMKSISDFINKRNLAILLCIILFFIVLFNIDFIRERTFERAINTITQSNASGTDRFEKIVHHIKAVKYSPIIGFGFGTCESYDGFTAFLGSIGVLGLGSFLIYIYSLIKNLRNSNNFLSKGYIVFLLCWISVFMVSVSELFYLFLWIHLATIDSVSKIKIQQIKW